MLIVDGFCKICICSLSVWKYSRIKNKKMDIYLDYSVPNSSCHILMEFYSGSHLLLVVKKHVFFHICFSRVRFITPIQLHAFMLHPIIMDELSVFLPKAIHSLWTSKHFIWPSERHGLTSSTSLLGIIIFSSFLYVSLQLYFS